MSESGIFSRRRLLATLGVLVVLVAIELSGAPRPALQRLSDSLQVVLCCAATWLCFRAGDRGDPPARRFWRLIAAGALIWTAAQFIWTWQAVGLNPQRLPTLTDFLFWIALIPWLLAVVARPDRPRTGTAGLWFDAALVAVLTIHVYGYATVGSLLAGSTAVYVEWPVVFWYVRDGLVIGSFLWLVVSATRPWRGLYADLLATMLMLHGGDTFANLFIVTGRYHPGLLDLPWTLPFAWLAVAAHEWRPGPEYSVPPVPTDWRHTRRGLLTATFAMVLVPASHLAYRMWLDRSLELPSLQAWLTLATTVLIGALFARRQLQLLRDLEGVQAEREGALRRSEERFQRAFDASPAVLSLSTVAEGRYVDVNDRCLQMFGYARAEMIGKTAHDLRVWIEPEARAELIRNVERNGRVLDYPARFRTKAGDAREVLTSVELITLDGVPYLLGQTEDLTDRRKLQERLAQSQRLESIGRLAGGVAHDFNNLLGIILGCASLVRARVSEDDPIAAKALQIERAAERAAGLTRQLLAFSSRQMLMPEVLDLGTLVRDTEPVLGRLVGEGVELTSIVEPGSSRVKADPSQLEQVLMNLVENAHDAMPRGGRLVLGVRAVDRESAGGLEDGVEPGRYVELSVSDTGLGISEEVRRHLFEPFFTTKEAGKGTGLGLATVHGIVEQSGGHIVVESAPGAGTTFRLYLPRVDAAGAHPAVSAAPSRGPRSVLLVEDEEALRQMMQEILSDAGYDVLEATNGESALEVAASHPGPIDLLLTDVVMPGLSGPRIAERLAAARPTMRVLYVSGYTAGELGPHGVLGPGVDLLQKPYSPEVLVARVREVLER